MDFCERSGNGGVMRLILLIVPALLRLKLSAATENRIKVWGEFDPEQYIVDFETFVARN